MNKVIFIDVDGPLTPDVVIKYHPLNHSPYPGYVNLGSDVTYWKFSETSVVMLNLLWEIFPYTFVVSSSWRKFCDREQMEDLFYTNGLKARIEEKYWCTRISNWRHSCTRASEISDFIRDHEITDYIVLDDVQSGQSLTDLHNPKWTHYDSNEKLIIDPKKVVMVNYDLGIGSFDQTQMRNIVKTW